MKRWPPDFHEWTAKHSTQLQANEGGDGKAARRTLELLGKGGWLDLTISGRGERGETPRLSSPLPKCAPAAGNSPHILGDCGRGSVRALASACC